METTQRRRVALLLGEDEARNARVAAGVAEHMREHQLDWNLLLPVAPHDSTSAAALMQYADAFIASADDFDLAALAAQGAQTVAVGLCAPAADTPAPTALADNAELAQRAYDYLISQGQQHFALFSVPDEAGQRAVREREQAFTSLARRDGAEVAEFRREGAGACFNAVMDGVIAWLAGLPRPVAILAADESRARLLSQACALAGYDTSSRLMIVAIDADPLAQELACVPMATVAPDRHGLGRRAALMLQRLFERRLKVRTESVAPLGLAAPANVAPPGYHPDVMRALHFIRLNARRGIKAEQVAYYMRMSRSSIEARFKLELGRTVHDEILRFKLEEAMQMLRRGAVSMPEVAVRCGFTSVQYLYTVFARELGCTPRVWQDRVLANGPAQ